MKLFFTLSVILVIFIFASPTQAVITFERWYGSWEADSGSCVSQTSDRGYIITGYYNKRFMTEGGDVYLLKTDSLGSIDWERIYGDSIANEEGRSVVQTSDGGYIIAGCSNNNVYFLNNVYLVKTDSLGNTVWERTYVSYNHDVGSCVVQTSDRGYIITGGTRPSGGGEADVYLIKTDSLGNAVWEKTYGGTSEDWGSCVVQTSDEGYIIAGQTRSFGAGVSDVYLIKTDPLGDTLWTKTYGGTDWDIGYSVALTSDGGYIITGVTESYGEGNGNVYLIKTDSSGDTVWEKTYGGYSYDVGYCVATTSDGGYIITGNTWSFGAGLSDAYLIKTDISGNAQWEKTFGDEIDDEASSVQQTSDGGYIITGQTDNFGTYNGDVYLIKTDGSGNVGIKEKERDKLTSHRLTVSPNPFSTSTTISIPRISEHQNIRLPETELNIYDVSGRLVKDFSLGTNHSSPITALSWDGKDNSGETVPGGIYFLKFDDGINNESVKVTIIR